VKPINLPVANREHKTYEGAAFEEWQLSMKRIFSDFDVFTLFEGCAFEEWRGHSKNKFIFPNIFNNRWY
jgi:hypothetical protein